MAMKANKSRENVSLERPSSSRSPMWPSRIQEKTDLQNLNDRLANYIDKVRFLEAENNRLTREVQTCHETVTREISDLKSMYDHELSDARKLLDETHKEKAKLEIDTKRLWDEKEELKAALGKKSKDLIVAENDAQMYEARANDIQLKYNQAQSEAKKITAEMRSLEEERDKVRNVVEDLRKQLENESLARVEVENANQSLREELSFKDQVYQQELAKTSSRRQVEISEIDDHLSEQYEAKLQHALQDLRDQYESEINNNRSEIQQLYENKIKDLQNTAQRNSSAAASAIEELHQTSIRVDALSSRIAELELSNASLVNRNRDMEKLLEAVRQRRIEDVATVEAELKRLRVDMAQELQKNQDLMDIKVSLDLEIEAYRKMMESEEARLSISPGGSPETRVIRGGSARRTPVLAGGKRKRTLVDESQKTALSDYSLTSSAKGDIEISEICLEGRYVCLHNKSNKEVVLSGWQLVRRTGDLDTLFKFDYNSKLEADATMTVWSSDTDQTHEPPTNIVMKDQKWLIGDTMSTVLINANGEEVAHTKRQQRQMTTSSLRHREISDFLKTEKLEHRQPNLQAEEKCLIM